MDETAKKTNVPVIARDQSPALTPPAKQPRPSSLPKWESIARERMKAAIKKFNKPLADLVARDANEGDTRLLVTDMLCEGFGFDKYSELTTEYRVKGEFADYGIRIDKDLIGFLEVKRVNTKLAAKHLRQVESYAVNEGVEWVILTSGVMWQVYHITGGLPIIVDLALEVDLLGENTTHQKANKLYYLTKESMKRRQMDDLWKAKKATSPTSLAKVLCSQNVAAAIR
jgi:predicted type IV restriction endonuclease